ncbi:TonB-dependent receptor [Saccharicrinis fermentans]|uniref:Outer membrane cobalamin receptor protein n=1 Tax=Saccharicrinis fermentans DSM 9555 = JCM 21142 TaxID=869213 RepID=W7Y0L2_9BACT|nr:TonB-dependent receptor [Saccharicrinis fermentans]GAF04455.1 outer membrane cobalamin receptor protein [Saccharicrinis fermentans DSM 9555 = JCM 21142]
MPIALHILAIMEIKDYDKKLFLITLLLINMQVFAQKCDVSGRIIDNTSHVPIAYANVALFSTKDSSFISGVMTDDSGKFLIQNIKTGTYQVKMSFIGYQSVIINDVFLQPGIRDLGETTLQMLSEKIDEVVIKSRKTAMSYKVDRKVIDAGSFPSADVAIDLLENVPSVQLDLDGNLTYRGDGTFKVYINGHPVANGVEKLRQLPVSRIDKVEIITNPSAKYDAEGSAGIIQVILKKSRLEGYTINSSVNLSTLGTHRWMFSTDKKTDKSGWYINAYWLDDVWSKYSEASVQHVMDETNSYLTNSHVDSKHGQKSSTIELGFNYDLSNKDFIDFSAYINPAATKQKNRSKGWVTEQMILVSGSSIDSTYYLNSLYNCDYQYVGGTLTYEHAFDKDRSHLLSAYVDYSANLIDLFERQYDEQIYKAFIEREGFVGSEHQETMIEGKFNYKMPLREEVMMETGAEINTDHIPRIASVSGTFDENNIITKYDNSPLNQEVDFIQDVYALYFLLKREGEKMAAQAGARMEFTDRRSDYSYDNGDGTRTYNRKRKRFNDFFPSAHITYNFTETNQLYLSYSKRIERPNYWKLVPLLQYQSAYVYYKGNGNVKPTYTDAWEVGWKKSWKKNFLSAELFTRKTDNVIQRYSKISEGNTLIESPENVGQSWSTGIEIMGGVDVFSWWNSNLSTSIYAYKLDVDFEDYKYTRKQLKADTRWNNTFMLPKSYTLKWDLKYNSPYKNAQTKRDAYFVSNLALKKEMKDGKWTATVVCSDIFSSEAYTVTQTGEHFVIKTDTDYQPYVSFKLAFVFDDQK